MNEFEEFSAEIGRRIDLVQGAGGNTSEKRGDVMRIKASGAWLADALEKPIFVDVDLNAMNAALAGEIDDATLKSALESEGDLRPSIETPLHALSPFRFVAHVHSATAIAWGARADARERLTERLSGIDWTFIPYERPGAPLAVRVREAYAAGKPSTLILANHGLVIAADSIAGLRSLLELVQARLEISAPDGSETAVAEKPEPPPGFEWVSSNACDLLARDEKRRLLAAGGSLYPDHVVFLGSAIMIVSGANDLATMIPPPKAAIVENVGVLVRKDLTKGARAMLECLGLVAMRLDPDVPVRYLSDADEAALLGWDAETYRQALDKRAALR